MTTDAMNSVDNIYDNPKLSKECLEKFLNDPDLLKKEIFHKNNPIPQIHIGIDLGTYGSVICYSKNESTIKPKFNIFINDLSNRITNSIISFDKQKRLIGEHAEARFSYNPLNTIMHIVNFTGCTYSEAEFLKERFSLTAFFSMQRNLQDDKNNLLIPITFNEQNYNLTTEFIISYYIGCLLKFAKVPITDTASNTKIVLSVPEFYTDKQISSIVHASKIIGLGDIDIKRSMDCIVNCWSNQNLPEFIDKFYDSSGNNKNLDQETVDQKLLKVAFIDFGYTQISFSIISITKSDKKTKDTETDQCSKSVGIESEFIFRSVNKDIGIHDIIMKVANYVKGMISEKYQKEVNWTYRKSIHLYYACLKVLKNLSGLRSTSLSLDNIFDESDEISVQIIRDDLIPLFSDIKDALISLLSEGLQLSHSDVDSICACEIVGGGSIIPFIHEAINAYFTNSKGVSIVRKTLDFAYTTATGAANFAANLNSFAPASEVHSDDNTINSTLEILKSEIELNKLMQDVEDTELRRFNCKNELESYALHLKDEASGIYKDLLSNEAFLNYLKDVEYWLSESDELKATEEDYCAKLKDLKGFVENHFPEYLKLSKEREESERIKFEASQKINVDRKLTSAEIVKKATQNKDEGNEIFKAGNMELTMKYYIQALDYTKKFVDGTPEEKEAIQNIKISTSLNLALCNMKFGTESANKRAISLCDEVIAIQPDNTKAFYRRSLANTHLKNYESAKVDVCNGLKFEPNNVNLLKLKKKIEDSLTLEKKNAQKLYSRMFR